MRYNSIETTSKGGILVDWSRIKADYIAGGTSYRKLAKKYDVPLRTIADRGKLEKWVDLKKQNCDKTVTKIVDAISDAEVDMATEAARIGKEASLYMLRQINKEAESGELKTAQIGTYPRAIEQLWRNLGVVAEQPAVEREINVIMGADGENYAI